jgi:short-subunit dehydrogenase
VTGASSGIDYALANQFAQDGFDLLIASRGQSLDEAAEAFEPSGADVERAAVYFSNYEDVEQLSDKIKSTGRPVDVIAIRAGVGLSGHFARETELKDELNRINLNVVSAVHHAKWVAKDLVERGQDRILFTSSIASTTPAPFEAVCGVQGLRVLFRGIDPRRTARHMRDRHRAFARAH